MLPCEGMKVSLMFNIYFKEMKKFFSLIALVGVFAACQPEGLTTAFEVGPAEATITAKVVDILTGQDVTSAASISPALTITGSDAIAEQDYTLTATYKEGTGSATVHINALRPGGKAHYSVVIPVGGNIGDYTLELKAGTPVETPKDLVLEAANTHGHAYSHNGHEKWVENASEFVLSDSATYKEYDGSEIVSGPEVLEAVFKENVENAAKPFDGTITSTTKTLNFKVSAWSLYNVFGTETEIVTPYELVATPSGSARVVGDNGVVGKFSVKTMASDAQYEECAHPSHASHYIHGHGTSEKAGSNAGGGIVEAL